MKALTQIFLFVNTIQTLTHWFDIGTGFPPIDAFTISGPKEEYSVQGEKTKFEIYTINWQTGQAVFQEEKVIGSNPPLSPNGKIQGDDSYNVVLAIQAVFRFNIKPGVPANLEQYPLPTGFDYSYPMWATGTVFMFVGAVGAGGANRKIWRLHSDKITGVEAFSIGRNSRAYGVLYGTGWLVASLSGTNERKLYDYTNGYDGGTSAAVVTHTKPAVQDELGFASPEDNKGYYVVGKVHPPELFTVNGANGIQRLHWDLNTPLNNAAISHFKWIYDTELCVVGSWAQKFVVVNYMDLAKPALAEYTTPNGGSKLVQVDVWRDYKAIAIPPAIGDKTFVFSAQAEMGCSGSCATCDGISRKKCLTCKANSQKVGDSCVCNTGFYSSKISFSTTECLTCSTLCETCSGGTQTDCSTCKYSYMEKKGDGSCGCPDGKFLSGTSCLDCDPTCKTCSGAGSGACLSCDVPNGKYLSGSVCLACDSSCKSCSGGNSNQCLSCDTENGKFKSGNTCLDCDTSCKSCSGTGATACLSCRISQGKYLSGGVCQNCDPLCKTCSGSSSTSCLSCDTNTGRFLFGSSCPLCHQNCSTCTGEGPNSCLQCSKIGYFSETGTCTSCSEKESSDCPLRTSILVPDSIEELTQNITITFKPSLKNQIPSSFSLTGNLLTQKHMSLKFKRKSGYEEKLTLLEQKLSHEESEGKSSLFVKFLEKNWYYNTEYLNLVIDDPWVYTPKKTNQNQEKLVYFKQEDIRISLTKKRKTRREKDQETARRIARVIRVAIGIAVIASMLLAVCARFWSHFAILVKFFNIIDILSSLSKLNVKFGPILHLIMVFIENLKLPELPFLAMLSPLRDKETTDGDRDAYQTVPRGTRGKITTSNQDVFVASGKGFVISVLIISFWILKGSLIRCGGDGSKAARFVTSTYQFLIGMVFFEILLISSVEISTFDVNKIGDISLKFILSLFLSMIILTLIISELLDAYIILKTEIFSKKVCQDRNEKKPKQTSFEEELLLDKYTEGIEINEKTGSHNYLILVQIIRFSVIEIIIGSLQLLNRTQALLVFTVNLSYLCYFIKVAMSAIRIHTTRLGYIKDSVQEGCIMVALFTITIFSFTEKISFSESVVYKMIELVAGLSIVGAIGSEFVLLCRSMWITFTSCKRRSKTVQNAKNSPFTIVTSQESSNSFSEQGLKERSPGLEFGAKEHQILSKTASIGLGALDSGKSKKNKLQIRWGKVNKNKNFEKANLGLGDETPKIGGKEREKGPKSFRRKSKFYAGIPRTLNLKKRNKTPLIMMSVKRDSILDN